MILPLLTQLIAEVWAFNAETIPATRVLEALMSVLVMSAKFLQLSTVAFLLSVATTPALREACTFIAP